MNIFIFTFIFNFLLVLNIFPQVAQKHIYEIHISGDMQTMHVSVQFNNTRFYRLHAADDRAADYIKTMTLFDGEKRFKLSPENSTVPLNRNAAQCSLYYEVDLSKQAGRKRRAPAKKVGSDILCAPDIWFWRPSKAEEIIVHFKLPEELNVSVPWKKIGRDKYLVPETTYNWPSAAAFGYFDIKHLKIPGAQLNVALLDGKYETSKEEILSWIKNAAMSVTNVFGFFPVKRMQVLVIPGDKKHEPVPFGMVVRGGGLSVQFFIDPRHPIKSFINDWTATHELSHALLPFIERDQMWLSEGLATYYQYILMARDGRLTEKEAWQRIYNGFSKGTRNSPGKSVKHTSENMHKFRAYPFVYWSGAAMLLKADVLLRKKTRGTQSLDCVLKTISKKILPFQKAWTGHALLREMDRISKTSIFTDVFNEDIMKRSVAIDDTFLKNLGIMVKEGKIILTESAPLAHIRKQIVSKNL